MFKLDETLQNALLAVASRYPDSLVEVNKDLLDPSDLWQGLCTVQQALYHLQVQASQLLQAPACLVIDDGQAISAIYLLDRSQEIPTLYLYSGHEHGQPYQPGLHEPVLTLQTDETLLEPSSSRQQ
jgi:hypothetical protein